jgi:hypothetical protein
MVSIKMYDKSGHVRRIEQVHVEVEDGAGGDGLSIQMRGAEDERTRPVGEAAPRLRNNAESATRVVRRVGGLAEHHAECAAQHVGGIAGRKDEGFFGLEAEAQPPEFERHGGALQNAQRRTLARQRSFSPAYGATAGIEVNADAGLKLSPRTLTCPSAGSLNSTVPRRFAVIG